MEQLCQIRAAFLSKYSPTCNLSHQVYCFSGLIPVIEHVKSKGFKFGLVSKRKCGITVPPFICLSFGLCGGCMA